MSNPILAPMARPTAWLRSVMTGRSPEHSMKDFSDTLRLNCAALFVAPDLYTASMEYRGGMAKPWDAHLDPCIKNRVVEAAAEVITTIATPQQTTVLTFPPAVGLTTHLDDAQDAAEDLTSALQDALRSVTSHEQTATVLACLESAAMLACSVSQLRKGGA